MSQYIKNYKVLNTTKLRTDALEIVEAGYEAIDTRSIIKKELVIEDGKLNIKGHSFEIKNCNRVFVIGFGKASCHAVQEIENILDGSITGGVVIDKNPGVCRVVRVYQGAHPLPDHKNVEFSDKIADLAEEVDENDLVIVVVSGGGSALLCWPISECDQGNDLYNEFLDSGGTIDELNLVRKHISLVKGGGLAKLLYPGTIISLIFSDVPGDKFEDVASGPTYYDESTIADASEVLKKYKISKSFILNETPKDKKLFEKVHNIPIVSNNVALEAMAKKSKELGYDAVIASSQIFSTSEEALDLLQSKSHAKTVVLGGGEVSVHIKNGSKGIAGRNEFLGMVALDKIASDQLFLSFASDGIDNHSEAAGVIIDEEVKRKISELKIDARTYKETNNEEEFFVKLGNQVITGPTGSNVSDLMFLIKE